MRIPTYNPNLTAAERDAIARAAHESLLSEARAIAANHKRTAGDVALIHVSQATVHLKWATDRIAALEARVAALEANPPLSYEGVYEAGKSYRKGQAATFAGSLWIAQRDTDGSPGTGDAWKLAVRKGRDAKEGGSRD